MTRPIRYAGFDPDEETFDDADLAPLHPQDLVKPWRQARTSINIDRAWELKRLGYSWDKVGRWLAIEAGRRIAYRGHSVRFAAHYATPAHDREARP